MLELSRTVRFCLEGDGSLAAEMEVHNSFAAWPAMRGLGRYYELEIVCEGEADAVTGYFLNIKELDRAARSAALPLVSAEAKRGGRALGGLMRDMMAGLREKLGASVRRVGLRLTPTYSISIEAKRMSEVLVTQQYEFAAAHRLHVAGLSEEENRRVFGKCNNAGGHGHNYRLEVTVRSGIDERGEGLAVEKLDAVVDRVVIAKLDHKHLNMDVAEFAGMNPSVENIARVIWGMVVEAVREIGVELAEIRVWETGKTVCTYRG